MPNTRRNKGEIVSKDVFTNANALKYFKLEKGATDKAKEPDPGGSLGYKKLKNRKTDHTVGLNYFVSNISSGTARLLQGMNNNGTFFLSFSFPKEEVRLCLTKYWKYNSSIQPYGQFFCFSVSCI